MENLKAFITSRGFVFGFGGIVVGLACLILITASAIAENWFLILITRWPYIPLLITPAGFIIITWLTHTFFKGAQGSGIPQTLFAIKSPHSHRAQSYLSLKALIGKYLVVLAYLCGGSLGYEGPAVHLGAAVMATIEKFLRVERQHIQRGLIVAGGAAGLAAAFSAPLTGIVFAIEELSKAYKGKLTSYILFAIILSGLSCYIFLGHYTFLGHAMDDIPGNLHGFFSYLSIPVCGVIGGALGSLFGIVLVYGNKKLHQLKGRYIFLIAGVAGLVVALISIYSHGYTSGCGDRAVRAIAAGQGSSLLYAPLKMLATLATYLAGIPVGLFAPSLAIGAGLSHWMVLLLPQANPQAVLLLIMVAYLCGVTQAPLTSFTIVMEITGQDAMLLPLMATSLIAKLIAGAIAKTPMYEALIAFLD